MTLVDVVASGLQACFHGFLGPAAESLTDTRRGDVLQLLLM